MGTRQEAGLPIRKLLRHSRWENGIVLSSNDRDTFHKTNTVPFFKKIFLGFCLFLTLRATPQWTAGWRFECTLTYVLLTRPQKLTCGQGSDFLSTSSAAITSQ